MDKKRLEKIKENVYTRCSIATTTGIGLTAPDREEVELIEEIERLNNIINELVEDIPCLLEIINRNEKDIKVYQDEWLAIKSVEYKLEELKGGNKE